MRSKLFVHDLTTGNSAITDERPGGFVARVESRTQHTFFLYIYDEVFIAAFVNCSPGLAIKLQPAEGSMSCLCHDLFFELEFI
jgi:hypothetical protein